MDILPAHVKTVLPTSGGAAVFLETEEKVFVIYMDHAMGAAITMQMRDVPKERPLTHDLIGSLLEGFGARASRVIVNEFREDIFFARLILEAENELLGHQIIELDARPSDAITIATQQSAPLFVTRQVLDAVEDMTHILEEMKNRGFQVDEDAGPPDAP